MAKSVLVFVSHSSENKEHFIEPLVQDLEDCYINVWIDKRKILPGENLRRSIFKEGLDKADVVLIFFTEQSLKSSWVDREIKHVLREEGKKGNSFDLNKIISIFDSKETYNEISDRYPELTDDLLHLMPTDYEKVQLGQLISAIWSKYLTLQGGDIEIQRQLLAKEKEIFQKDKEIHSLKLKLDRTKTQNKDNAKFERFQTFLDSGKVSGLLKSKDKILKDKFIQKDNVEYIAEASAFGLVEYQNENVMRLTDLGREFFEWFIINKSKDENS